MGIPMLKKRRSWDHFILNMGIPILVRRHFHTDTAPRTYADSLSIGLFGTNFSAIQIKIQQISFKKIMVKMLYAQFQPFCSSLNALTHWGQVTHIYISKLTTIGSDNGLSHGQCQSHHLNQCWNIVNWTLRNKLQWYLNLNLTFSFKKIHLKMLSGKWRQICLGLNVLRHGTSDRWVNARKT